MNTSTQTEQDLHQQHLNVALERVRQLLEAYVEGIQGVENREAERISSPSNFTPSPLNTLCTAFGLTPFERDILTVCAGVELSAAIARLCGIAQGNEKFTYPTFSLMLATLPDAHWSALTPVAPLRRWQLIEVAAGESLTTRRLSIDERVLHYLSGVSYLDDRLQGWVKPCEVPSQLPPSHQRLADQITQICSQQQISVIQICGGEAQTSEAIATVACSNLGLNLHTIRAIDIPANIAEREALARLWEREVVLSHGALLVDCTDVDSSTVKRNLIPWVETVQGFLLIASPEPVSLNHQYSVRFEVNPLSATEQLNLWQQTLGTQAAELNGNLDVLVSQFQLDASTIQTICTEVVSVPQFNEKTGDDLSRQLWNTCRKQSRSGLDNLAQRIEPTASWENFILPQLQHQMLREIAAQVRQRTQVYQKWEFTGGTRGLGISVLFAGASGTGKTMAAEVLAKELSLDLYRIDLSQIVNKYIGETEKNLRRVFDAAERSGAILLFDEADALFGKRSEVKDSHDRYANIEVSYLLQRMEAYRGLAILTTNLKNALDTAFLRRLRFVVEFPFPNLQQRSEIWRRIFSPKVPTNGLEFQKLAKLNVTGGNIRNIALNAAFLAADAGESVQMKHLLRAAQSEYAKLEKPLISSEVGDWL